MTTKPHKNGRAPVFTTNLQTYNKVMADCREPKKASPVLKAFIARGKR